MRTETLQIKVSPEQKHLIEQHIVSQSFVDGKRYNLSSYLLDIVLNTLQLK